MKKKQIYCNHRTDDNLRDCLTFNPETGYCVCRKCGANFKPLDISEIQETKVKETLDQLDALLNTLKLLAADSSDLMNEINKQCKAAHKLRKLPKLAQACYIVTGAKIIRAENCLGSTMFDNLNALFDPRVKTTPPAKIDKE